MQLTTFTLPPGQRTFGQFGLLGDQNNTIAALVAMGTGLSILNTAFNGGADPLGNVDATVAIQECVNACAPGQFAYVPVGTYKVSQPISLPPGVGIYGDPSTATIRDTGGGSKLQATSGFTAGPYPISALIVILDETTGAYTQESSEQHIGYLWLEGKNLPTSGATMAANTNGVSIWSDLAGTGSAFSTGQISLTQVFCRNMSGWGFNMPNATGQVRAFNCIARNCGSNNANNAGGWQVHSSDSNYLYCESNSNYGDAWQILNSYDSEFTMCHGEHSANGYGFNYQATYNNSSLYSGGITFNGCTTDAGALDGFYFTSGTGTTNMPPITVVGGYARRPGEASTSGGYAGYHVNAYFGTINFIGCQSYPGQADNQPAGSYQPQYGISFTNNGNSTSVFSISGGVYVGVNGGINQDGSQKLLEVSADTIFGTGTGNNTVMYCAGVSLQAANVAQLTPVDQRLITMPTGCLAATQDRTTATNTFTPTSGTVYYRLVTLIAGLPITNINTWVTGTGKSGGTHAWVHIVSVATGKVVATSNDFTDGATTWSSTNAVQSSALSAQYTPPITGAYWFGVMIVATTPPSLAVGPTLDSNIASQPPIVCGAGATGQTTPPPVGTAAGPTSGLATADLFAYAT